MSRTIYVKGLQFSFTTDATSQPEIETEAREMLDCITGLLAEGTGYELHARKIQVLSGPMRCDNCESETDNVSSRLDPLATLDGQDDYMDLCQSCLKDRLTEADPQEWAYPHDDYDEYPHYHDGDPVRPQIDQFGDDLTVLPVQPEKQQ